jgi:hypothetical protein
MRPMRPMKPMRPMTPIRNRIRLLRGLVRDCRGTSMVTTAITLPLLIVLVAGIYYLLWFLTIKQTLHDGVLDAANYISDQARFWNIDPTGQSKVSDPTGTVTLYPADYYDWEARRVIANRLRDFLLPTADITANLHVTVTEPILAFAPDATPEAPVDVGQDWTKAGLCGSGQAFRDKGEFRAPENIRFRIMASYTVSLWTVSIPYLDAIHITLHDRATGYVQCPRWAGQYQLVDPDVSKWLAQEGPFMPYRNPVTPGFPTVTATMPPTITPTAAPPTQTPTETPTGP